MRNFSIIVEISKWLGLYDFNWNRGTCVIHFLDGLNIENMDIWTT